MSLVSLSDHIEQAKPIIHERQWLYCELETALVRKGDVEKAIQKIPAWPEVKSSADVIFFSEEDSDAGVFRVVMAADPGVATGRRLFLNFLEWGAKAGLRAGQVCAPENQVEIRNKLVEAGFLASPKRRGCLPLIALVSLAVGLLGLVQLLA